MRHRVGDDRDAAVVRDVQRLVRVGRPGVGAVHPGDEMPQPGGGAAPTGRTRRRHAPTRRARAPAAMASANGSNAPECMLPACRQTIDGRPSGCRPARRRARRRGCVPGRRPRRSSGARDRGSAARDRPSRAGRHPTSTCTLGAPVSPSRWTSQPTPSSTAKRARRRVR